MTYVRRTKSKVKTNVKLETREPWELCAVRHNLGLTGTDMGNILGVSKKLIYAIECDVRIKRSCAIKLYSIILEEICKEQGKTFDEVLASGFLNS